MIYALLVVAAVAKALMDLSSEGKLPWNPAFWDKSVSWVNKWKRNDQGGVMVGVERFPLSSTVLVFLTDGWHLMQFVFLSALFLAAFGFTLKFLISRIVFGVVFELTRRVFERK